MELRWISSSLYKFHRNLLQGKIVYSLVYCGAALDIDVYLQMWLESGCEIRWAKCLLAVTSFTQKAESFFQQ